MDNSPKLIYEAHQKHEEHNRKSTRLSVLAGKMRFVLPRRIGYVGVYDSVPERLVLKVLEDYQNNGKEI